MEQTKLWTHKDNEYRLSIKQDDRGLESPRNYGLGTMACWHRRDNYGDVQPSETPDEHRAALPKGTIIVPIYMYDHSGVVISTTPFGCTWDSGQLGYIYLTPEDRTAKAMDDTSVDNIKNYLAAAVATYSQWISGDVWGFVLERRVLSTHDWEDVDSCWGFYGNDPTTNGMNDYLPQHMPHKGDAQWTTAS